MLSTVDLLALTRLDQLLFILKTCFQYKKELINQGILTEGEG
jgi:hypothetical protein